MIIVMFRRTGNAAISTYLKSRHGGVRGYQMKNVFFP